MAGELTKDERTTAVGLARYAYEYLAAARLVDRDAADRHPGQPISPVPAYFLALHGIELTLKAYLRYKGLSVKELSSKSFGHDIHALHRKAKEMGLGEVFKETPEDAKAMRLLIDLNAGQGLRYMRTGVKEFPYWSIVEPLAIRLHQGVAPLVGFETFKVVFPAYLESSASPSKEG